MPRVPKKSAAKPTASWAWENDAGDGYNDFDAKAGEAVEALYQKLKGTGKGKLKLNGRPYEFDFSKMLQTNTDTSSARKVQRKETKADDADDDGDAAPPAAAPKLPITWQWKKDKGAWSNCDSAGSNKLEELYTAASVGDTVAVITIGAQKYDVDFERFTQMNQSSKFSRELRRLEGTKETESKFAPKVGGKKPADDAILDAPAAPAKKVAVAEAPKSVTAGTSSGGASSGMSAGGPGKTKMVKKGRGVVDTNSGMQDKAHIYEAGEKVYQVTLNQTNIAQNNNKFYVIQLLESDKGGEYWVWTRWGRVGVIGQSNLDKAFSLPAAIAAFCKKFRDKTSNDFNNLKNFTKVNGKYQLMEMDYGDADGDADAAAKAADAPSATPAAKSSCTLDGPLKDFMSLISNKSDMERAMKELEVDTAKMPLGKIKKSQIKEAFGYLKQIETELKKSKPSKSDIVNHSSMFYTLIPHDFGFSVPPPIGDETILKRKMELLEVLSDLEVASKLMDDGTKTGKHPLDAAYDGLKCGLTPLSHDDPTFKRIVEFATNTHGATHSGYKLVVEDVFAVDRQGETARYEAFSKAINNKQLLWHGSRTTNYMGILSQGLRIAPPEAPCTGYMFGKGVYFADSVSKSANYCHATPSNPVGVMLLCEAALGTPKLCYHADYMDKPKPGTHSTKGVGRNEPNDAAAVTVDGVKWPLGKMHPTPACPTTTLQYNEFIVYDVAQCKMNYALKVRFVYKK